MSSITQLFGYICVYISIFISAYIKKDVGERTNIELLIVFLRNTTQTVWLIILKEFDIIMLKQWEECSSYILHIGKLL